MKVTTPTHSGQISLIVSLEFPEIMLPAFNKKVGLKLPLKSTCTTYARTMKGNNPTKSEA